MSVIKRNLGWLLLSQCATWIVSVAVLIIAPRELGDAAFGQLTFAQVYVGFFELVAIFGTGTYLAKTLARDRESVGRYILNTLALKVVVTIGLAAVAIALAAGLGLTREIILLIAAFYIGMFFSTLNSVLVGGLQGLQRMVRPALWEVLRNYTGATLGLTVLMNGGSLLAYAFVISGVTAIPLAANLVYLWPDLRKSLHIDLILWREVLAGGFPFFVLSAFTVIYATADIPILEALASDETVGWYSLALRWVAVPVFVASAVSAAFFPALAVEGQGQGDPEAFARLANRALSLTFLVAAPAALGIALIADDFLQLLYGSEFEQAAPIMQLLAFNVPLIALDLMFGSVVIAADRQRPWVVLSVTAAIANPLVNLGAVPLTHRVFDNGALGAAFTTVLTELFIFVGAMRLRPPGVLDRPTAGQFVRIAVASSTMVPIVLLLGSTPLLIRVVAGAATYGIVSFALGTISMRDFRSLGTEAIAPQPQASVAP